MIRNRRKEVGLKPGQLADLAQLSHRTIDGIEAGTANPTWTTVKQLAHALDWTIADVAQRTVELDEIVAGPVPDQPSSQPENDTPLQ